MLFVNPFLLQIQTKNIKLFKYSNYVLKYLLIINNSNIEILKLGGRAFNFKQDSLSIEILPLTYLLINSF